MSNTIFKGDTRPAFTANVGFDVSGADTIELELAGPRHLRLTAAAGADAVAGDVSMAWQATHTATAGTYETRWIITTGDEVRSVPGDPLVVVDLVTMWGRLADLEQLVPVDDKAAGLRALVSAEGVVRSWIERRVRLPCPDRIRKAIAIVASRNMEAGSHRGEDGEMPIVEEQIDAVNYRYQAPERATFALTKDLAQLLKPWLRNGASMYIGPSDPYDYPVPISPPGPNEVAPTVSAAGGSGDAGSASA